MFKSLLNNLIGRFGLNIYKPITKEVDLQTRDYIASTRELTAQHVLFNNNFLITYKPEVSREVCAEHGLDYFKVVEREVKNVQEIKTFKDTSLATTAMINSYARIYMNKIKLLILRAAGTVFYTDTDSLVVDNIAYT
jgi:hypothetical protein